MQNPATSMTKHLMWTRSGVVWATWRLQGLAYGFGTKEMKKLVRAHHQALFQSLRGEALIMGLCANEDPVAVAERMLAGVQIDECEGWRDEVMRTLDSLEEIPIGTRAFWISVPLSAGSMKHRALSQVRAASTSLREKLALPHQVPSENEVTEALKAADAIEERIPAPFKATPASAADQFWIAMHSQHRGLNIDQSIPTPTPGANLDQYVTTEQPLAHYLPSHMPEPFLDEGGQSDLEHGQRFLPFSRRYLKVQSPHSDEASYQVVQALASTPKGGWEVPGFEWISRIEQFNLSVDWAVRLTVTSGADVRRRNKKAESSLDDQIDQQGNDSSITGGASGLEDVAEALSAYHRSLNRSDKEVEVEATTMFAVGAPTPDEAKARARFIAEAYKRTDFIFEAPLGGQEHLWWAMQPGTPAKQTVREYAQLTTGREFASAVPFATVELGDEKGIYCFDNISAGQSSPVLIDIQGSIEADSSGSIGIVAELGAGKSYTIKGIVGDELDRGSRAFIIDRTELKEYAHFAKSLKPGDTAIVDILSPEYSLDPIRVFGALTGARHVQSLFATMLGIKARDPLGVALSRVLAPAYVTANGITSISKLRDHLADAPEDSERGQLYGLMNLIAGNDFGAVLFDDSLPPLDLNAQAIIALTHGLALPDETELTNQHLFDEMPIEKIFGRAMYMLLTSIAREVCFMDPGQLALFVVDEAHHVTASPEGERELVLFLRDGRKHGAACVLASHDPMDFGDVVTRGLIKIRLVMRQTDRELARRALEWLAGLGEDEDMIKEVTENLSPTGANGEVAPERRGEGFLRDVRGRLGKVKKRSPQREERRLAMLSTPSKNRTPSRPRNRADESAPPTRTSVAPTARGASVGERS